MKRRDFLKVAAGAAAAAACPVLAKNPESYLVDPNKWVLAEEVTGKVTGIVCDWFCSVKLDTETLFWEVHMRHKPSDIQWAYLVPEQHLANRGITISDWMVEQQERARGYIKRVEGV